MRDQISHKTQNRLLENNVILFTVICHISKTYKFYGKPVYLFYFNLSLTLFTSNVCFLMTQTDEILRLFRLSETYCFWTGSNRDLTSIIYFNPVRNF